ncbi:MAG: response regulator [Pseudomonadota bacterium]
MSDEFYAKLRVLVVDDNKHARKLAQRILNALGCSDVKEAVNAEEAWSHIVSQDFHILLLDYKMEPVDGISLAKRIRTDPASPHPGVPIILVTAEPSLQAMQAARAAGIDEVLPKPFSPQGLKERVEAIVKRADSAQNPHD